jgi:RND superfamily putative drug exporter
VFASLGRLASRRPWWIIAVWILVAVVVGVFAPKLQTTSEESEFLPDHYESIKAADIQAEKFPGATTPAAILVFEREDGKPLTEEDRADVERIAEELGPGLGKDTFVQQVVTVNPQGRPNVSEDGLVQLGIVGLAEGATGFDQQAFDDAQEMRDDLEPLVDGTDLRVPSSESRPSCSSWCCSH